jgi:prepilin-type N-terminal cleavage/methylation domain-containing protein
MTSNRSRGFTLLEMMITVAIILIMAAVAVLAFMPVLELNHVNSAYDTTLSVIRNYRNLSITQGKRYIVTFTTPGTITVQRWDYAVPVSPAPVTVQTFTLPTDITYAVQAGFPSTSPDGFGTGIVAIDFDQNMGLGSQNYIMFMPDGSSQDTLGNYNSGVIYMSRTGDIYNSRAITVWGTTGRVRGWRIVNQSAVYSWIQQ